MKKRGKRVGVFLLCLVFIFINTFYVKAYSYNYGYKVNVEIGENYGKDGQDITIPIRFSNLPYSGLSAVSFVLEFDENLSFNFVTPGDIIDNKYDFSYNVKDNKIYFVFSDSKVGNNPIKKEGNFCYINFKVNKSYKSSYVIQRIANDKEVFIDNYLNKVDSEFKPGKIAYRSEVLKVANNKIWKITFSHELDIEKVRAGGVEVKDIKGNIVNCKFYAVNLGKTLEIVPPEGGYKLNNSYSIEVKNSLISKKGKKIIQPYTYYFYIKD